MMKKEKLTFFGSGGWVTSVVGPPAEIAVSSTSVSVVFSLCSAGVVVNSLVSVEVCKEN